MIIMKTNQIIISLTVLLFSYSSLALEDYVSPQLFFTEALTDYNSNIVESSVEISHDLSTISQLRKDNFQAKSTQHNTLEAQFETYKVSFTTRGHLVVCLGAIFPIDHQLMTTEPGQELQERSGLVYLSECEVSQGQTRESFPPNFEIRYAVAFPKVESLPITAGSSLVKYQLLKSVTSDNKLTQCVSADSNSFGAPRNSFSVYNMDNHFAVGIQIGSSSTDAEVTDIPVSVGEIDLGSLPWLQDNINFIMGLGPEGSSAFNLIFNKKDCQVIGPKKAMTTMACRADILDPNEQVKKIEKVQLIFQSKGISKVAIDPNSESGFKMDQTMEFDVDIEFTVDEPNKYHSIFPKTIYRTSLKYQANEIKGQECQFAAEFPDTTQQETPAALGTPARFEF